MFLAKFTVFLKQFGMKCGELPSKPSRCMSLQWDSCLAAREGLRFLGFQSLFFFFFLAKNAFSSASLGRDMWWAVSLFVLGEAGLEPVA